MIQGYETEQLPGLTTNGIEIGHFAYFTDKKALAFIDCNNKYYSLDRIKLMQGEFDFSNGSKNFPKPYVIDGDKIVDYGANVLYTNINNSENIVVIGVVHDVNINHYFNELNFDLTDIESLEEKSLVRYNNNRFFKVYDNGKGNIEVVIIGNEGSKSGNLVVKVKGDKSQENGNIKLELNGKFIIDLVNDKDEVYAQQIFDNTKDDEKISIVDKHKNRLLMNKKGMIVETTTIRIGKNETLNKILQDLLNAIKKMTNNTPGGPTIAPPLNWGEFESIKSRLNKFMDIQ